MNQKQFGMQGKKMIKDLKNLNTLTFILILLSILLSKNGFAKENYVVSIVNKLPLTKIDVINRAKLIAFSVEKNYEFKNLRKFYSQSIKALVNERIIISEGLKINKNIDEIVSDNAYLLALSEYNNSEIELIKFIKKSSISKSTILDKYKAQLIWGIVLKKKYKVQLKSLEKKFETELKINKKNNNEDLYDLAEIVLIKKNNLQLLNQIKSALKQGINFLDIAKQVSISSSSKFNGKIGWKNFEDLPDFIKNKKSVVNEGDIYSFATENKIKIFKILAKRVKGKISDLEKKVLLAQIQFLINFQKRDDAYLNLKNKLDLLLKDQNNCLNLKNINDKKNNNIRLKIIKSRIADLSPIQQRAILNMKLYQVSKPLYIGNSGYTYVICDTKNIKSNEKNPIKIKKQFMNKHYLILSEKLLKKLAKQANIVNVKKMK